MPAVEIGSSAWPLPAKNTTFLSAQRPPAQRRGSACAVGGTALNGTRHTCPGDGGRRPRRLHDYSRRGDRRHVPRAARQDARRPPNGAALTNQVLARLQLTSTAELDEEPLTPAGRRRVAAQPARAGADVLVGPRGS
jgi:hypothetical protein